MRMSHETYLYTCTLAFNIKKHPHRYVNCLYVNHETLHWERISHISVYLTCMCILKKELYS